MCIFIIRDRFYQRLGFAALGFVFEVVCNCKLSADRYDRNLYVNFIHRTRDYLILALLHLYFVFGGQFSKQQSFSPALSIIFFVVERV